MIVSARVVAKILSGERAVKARRTSRRGRRLGLLMSTFLMQAAPVLAQAGFQGTVTPPTGTTITRAGTTDTIRLTNSSTVLDWTATGPVRNGAIDFLPAGSTGAFVGAPGLTDFVVLNRVLPGASSAPIAFNGTITAQLTDTGTGALKTGGTVWFYSPGGIIAGPTAIFDVGSLLLTADAVNGTGGPLNARGFSVAGGAAGASVEIRPGAQIRALQPGSYVAVVAPRVVQAGSVRVNGSAAYVPAAGADLTIDGGLFNISITTGSDGTALTHTGSTTGPAADGMSGVHRVYLVSVPKNDAVTMLVSGTLGFDAATSARIENGAVVLLAGAGDASDTTANLTDGTIAVRGATFTSRVFAGTGTFDVSASDAASAVTFAAGGLTVSATNGIGLQADGAGAVIADRGATSLYAYATGGQRLSDASSVSLETSGGAINLLGDVLIDASTPLLEVGGSSGGGISLNADGGGSLDFGRTTLLTGATGASRGRGASAGEGGVVTLATGSGPAHFAALAIDTSGVGGESAFGGAEGRAGVVDISIGNAQGIGLSVDGDLSIAARGIGGEAAGSASSGEGAGGPVTISAGSTIRVGGSTTIDTTAQGGAASGGDGGQGMGGGVSLIGDGRDAFDLHDLTILTGGSGGARPRGASNPGSGGAGLGGTVTFIQPGGTFGAVSINAIGTGGGVAAQAGDTSGSGEGGTGGAGKGGDVTIGSAIAPVRFAVLSIGSSAIGGAGNTGQSGSPGNGGDASGGTVSLAGGTAFSIGGATAIDASALSGMGSTSGTQAGAARGGDVTINSGDLTRLAALSVDVGAHAPGGAAAGNVANAGTIAITADRALDASGAVSLKADAATDSSGTGAGAATGGSIDLRASANGGVLSLSTLSAEAIATGGGGYAGGAATAGDIALTTREATASAATNGGTIAVSGATSLRATATGGSGTLGGTATGGSIGIIATPGGTVRLDGGTRVAGVVTGGDSDEAPTSHLVTGSGFQISGEAGSHVTVGGTLDVDVSAAGGDASYGNVGTGYGASPATGGAIAITMSGNGDPAGTTLTLGAVTLASNGTGGSSNAATSPGAAGTGGGIAFSLDDVTGSIASLAATANGTGGAGVAKGGDGNAGTISLAATLGSLAVPGALTLTASGIVARQDTEAALGAANAGTITVRAIGGGDVTFGAVTLDAHSYIANGGGAGGEGAASIGTTGGTLSLASLGIVTLDDGFDPGPAERGTPTASGDVTIVSRGSAQDRFAVGGGPATLDFTPDDASGSGPIRFTSPNSTIAYTGPATGKFGILSRIDAGDAGRPAYLAGTIVATSAGAATTAGEIGFYSAGGVVMSNGAGFGGGRLVLTTDAAYRPDVSAGAFQGTPNVVSGSVSFERTSTLDTIRVGSRSAVIDWTPNDSGGAGPIDFLPTGLTALFQNDPAGTAGFTVLNRILPADGTRQVVLDGTVRSRLTADGTSFAPGGTLWFYSPGGILIGARGVFDVGSLLLTANAVTLGPGFAPTAPDGTIALIGDGASAAQVNVAAGATLAANAADGSVILAAPHVVQDGTVTVNRAAAYIAAGAATIRPNDGRADVALLAPTTGTPGDVILRHTGSTTGPASGGAGDPRRILLAASGAGGIVAGGTLGFGVGGDAAIVVAAGYDIATGAIGANAGSPTSLALTGGTWLSRVTASASDTADIAGSGITRFDGGLSVTGVQRARLFARSGDAIRIGGSLQLDTPGGTSAIEIAAGGSLAVAGDAAITAAGSTPGDAAGGDAHLSADGDVGAASLLIDAGARGAGATGGTAALTIGTGRVTIAGDTRIMATADATGTRAATGGSVALRGGGGGGATIGGGLLLDASAGTSDGTASSLTAGDVVMSSGSAPLAVTGTATLLANATSAPAGATTAAGTIAIGGGAARFGDLRLAAIGGAGDATAITIAATGGGTFAVARDLAATTSGALAIDVGAGSLAVGGAATLDAGRDILVTGAAGGGGLAAARLAATAGGGFDGGGVRLAAADLHIDAAAIATGDLTGGTAIALRATGGDIRTGALTGGAIMLDATGLIETHAILSDRGVALAATGAIGAGDIVTAGRLDTTTQGHLTLGAVTADAIALTGGQLRAGAIVARNGDLGITARGGAQFASAQASGGVTVQAGMLDADRIASGGAVRVAADEVRLGSVGAGIGGSAADLTIGGDAVTITRDARATGNATFAVNGPLAIGQDLVAGGTASLTASGMIRLAAVDAGDVRVRGGGLAATTLAARAGAIDADAGDGALTTASATATGAVTLRAAGALAVDVIAGDALLVRGGTVRIGSAQADLPGGSNAIDVGALAGDLAIDHAAGGAITVTSSGLVTLGMLTAASGLAVTAGTVSATDLTSAGDTSVRATAGGIAIGRIAGGGAVALSAANGLALGTVDAIGPLAVAALAGDLGYTTLAAGTTLAVTAAGAIGGGGASAGDSLTFGAAGVTAGDLRAGGSLVVTGRTGGIGIGSAAGASVDLGAATDLATGALTSRGDERLRAAGTITIGGSAQAAGVLDARAGGALITQDVAAAAVSLTGSSVASGAVRATGGDLSVAGGGGDIATGRLDATGDIGVAGRRIATGAIAAAGAVTLDGSSIDAGDLAAGTGLSARSRTAGLVTGAVAGATVTLAAATDLAAGAVASRGAATLGAGGTMALAGDLTASGRVAVTAGGAATLANVSGTDLALRGATLRTGNLDATAGDVDAEATGALTLADVTGRDLMLRGTAISAGALKATVGGIDARAPGVLRFAAADAAGDVALAGGAGIDAGATRAGGEARFEGALIGSGDLILAVGGGLSFGDDIERTGALSLTAAGDLSLRGARAASVTLRGASIVAGDLVANIGDIDVASTGANGGLVLGAVTANGGATLTAPGTLALRQATAGGSLMVAGSAVRAGALGSGSDVVIAARGGAATLATIAAARDITVRASDGVALRDVSAGRDLVTEAGSGGIAFDRLAAAGTLRAVASDVLRGGELGAGGAVTLDAAAIAAGNVTTPDALDATARTGSVTLGTVTAGEARIAAASDLALAGLTSDGDATLSAGGGIGVIDAVAAGGAFSATAGGALSFADVRAGGLSVRGAALTANALVATDADIDLGANTVSLASADARGGLRIASSGDMTAGRIVAGGDARIDGATIRLGSIGAGGTLALTATGNLIVGRLLGATAAFLRGAGLALDQADNVGTLGLTSTGDIASGSLAAGAIDIASGGAVTGTSLSASAGGIAIDGGSVDIGSLAAVGPIAATASGPLVVRRASSGTSLAFVSTAGDVTLTDATTLFQSPAALTAAATPPADGGIAISAARDVGVDGQLAARTTLAIAAGATVRVAGQATGATVAIAAADVAIAPTGRIGAGAATRSVRFDVTPGLRAVIGGDDASGLFSLSNAEIGRVQAQQIVIGADRAGTDPARDADVTIGALGLRHDGGGGDGSLYGDGALFRVETPGTIRVAGAVSATNFGANDRIELAGGELIDIAAPIGSVTIAGSDGAPSGRLQLASDRIVVATDGALQDVQRLTTADARGDRLGQTDGAVAAQGYVVAGGLTAAVGASFYVQNTGGTTTDTRAGFTVGQSGLTVLAAGMAAPEVIINGRGAAGSGTADQTGREFIAAVAGFAPGSSANGCASAATLCVQDLLAVQLVTPVTNATTWTSLSAVQSTWSDAADSTSMTAMGDDGVEPETGKAKSEGKQAARHKTVRVLVSMPGKTMSLFAPPIDDPVTSVGNDDLWLGDTTGAQARP